MDIDEEPGLVDNNVLMAAGMLDIIVAQHIVTDEAAGLPDAQGGGGGFQGDVFKAGGNTAQEVHNDGDLLAQQVLRLHIAFHGQGVSAVALGGIDVPLALIDGAVDADDADILRQLAGSAGILADLAVRPSVGQLNGVRAAGNGEIIGLI